MTRKIRQRDRNLAEQLYKTSTKLNDFSWTVVTPAAPEYKLTELRDLEDELFASLVLIRQYRKAMMVPEIRAAGGQRA